MQCVIMSVGSVDEHYIITEEPEPRDHLIQRMRVAVDMQGGLQPISMHDSGLHLTLPFELRCLEVVLEEAAKLLMVEVRGVVRSARMRMDTLNATSVRPPVDVATCGLARCMLMRACGETDSRRIVCWSRSCGKIP